MFLSLPKCESSRGPILPELLERIPNAPFSFFILLPPFAVVFLEYAPPVQAQEVEEKVTDSVFTGSQLGEALPGFKVTSLTGEFEGKILIPLVMPRVSPLLLSSVQELTRSGFGLMRVVTQFSAERKEKEMNVAVVFLTDDATATAKCSKNVQRTFSDNVQYGMFTEGKEMLLCMVSAGR